MIATDIVGFEAEFSLLYRLGKDWFIDVAFAQANATNIGPTTYDGQYQSYLMGMSWER